MGRLDRAWRWLNEPLGGRTVAEIPEDAADEPSVARQIDESRQPAPAQLIELGRVHALFEFAGDAGAPPPPASAAQTTSHDARVALEQRRSELELHCDAAVRRIFGPDARTGEIELREGASVEVIVPVLVGAVVQSPWVADLTAALVELIVNAVRRVLGGANAPAASTGYFAPAAALLQPAAAAPAGEAADSSVAKWLAGAGAFMTATLAVVGITATDFDPVRLNEGSDFALWFAVLIAAILFGVVWPLMKSIFKRLHFGFLILAVLAVGVAMAKLVDLSTDSLSAKATPRIDVDFEQKEGATRLVGTAVADGVTDSEQLRVRVIGIGADGGRGVIHRARAGAPRDGKADVNFRTAVNAGEYDRVAVTAALRPGGDTKRPCAESPHQVGCVVVAVPVPSRQPSLNAKWEVPEKGLPTLAITGRMAGLSARDRVHLNVRPRRKDGKLGGRRYAVAWNGGADGTVNESIELLWAPKRSVCIVMRAKREPRQRFPNAPNPYGPCTARAGGVSVLIGPPPPPPPPAE